jgi:hypothetical protein
MDDISDIESELGSITLEKAYTPKSSQNSSPILQEPPVIVTQPIAELIVEPITQPIVEPIIQPIVESVEKFTWNKLDEKWEEILLTNNFVIKDCKADGNCQFRSLEEALKKTDQQITHKNLRKLIADHVLTISETRFKEILDMYILEKENDEFHGEWDPLKIKTRKQFINELKKPGFNFEGDNLTLVLLSEVLKIDFLIFNETSHTITDIETNGGNQRIVILYFIKFGNTGHYNTIGLKNNKLVKTLFLRNFLDDDINNIIDKNIFFRKHIEHIHSTIEKFTCNNVIKQLVSIINISKSDKKLICKLLALFVKNKPKKSRKLTKSKSKSKSRKSRKTKTKSKSKSKSRKSRKLTTSKSKSKSRKSRKTKTKSKSKSKSRKSRKSRKTKTKSKSKSKSRKSRKSRKTKTKSKSKSKSKSRKSPSKKSRKSKSKSLKRSVKRRSKKRSVKRRSKKRSVKRRSKKRSVKRRSKKRSVKRRSKKRSSKNQ